MAGSMIMGMVSFGCGIVFYSIGVYAEKLTKPMGFWSGTEVDASKITDVGQYNKENSVMWKLYSLWYFAAGAAGIWNSMVSVVCLVSSCTIGLVLLIRSYNRIYRKYSVR